MNELKKGKRIRLTDGTSVEVLSQLGQGAQGTVYKVRRDGREYALKWYLREPSEAFYENLQKNASHPSPSPSFLWPLAVTERTEGSAGYLMELIPKGYHDLGAFLLGRVQFTSFDRIVRAALGLCNAFQKLHREGYSYQDINDGNIVIHPTTGDVLIVDNDNVSTNNTNFGIRGKSRYMAAEIIGGGMPNIESDLMSLAILLYRLFMVDHPFEGQMILRIPCMTEEYERRFYGHEAVFCHDPSNAVNRPHPDIHRNSVLRWELMPRQLREAFCQAFSREAIENPGRRMRERQWKDILVGVRALLVVCPKGGRGGRRHDFLPSDLHEAETCPLCGAKVAVWVPLRFRDGTPYILTPGKDLYLEDSLTPSGECCIYQSASGKEPGLKNTSGVSWALLTPGGRIREVRHGEVCPLRGGMQICFSSKITCNVS